MRRRDVAIAAACLVLGWLGLRGQRVPLLGFADLGFHELGHLVGYVLDAFLPWPQVLTAAAGSALQVGVPVGLAAYFLGLRRDRAGGAVCLAWAATSAHDVARYVADAPYERLPLIGGHHDWAFILRPHLDLADDLAYVLQAGGFALLGAGLVVACWPWIGGVSRTAPRDARPRPVPSPPGAGAP